MQNIPFSRMGSEFNVEFMNRIKIRMTTELGPHYIGVVVSSNPSTFGPLFEYWASFLFIDICVYRVTRDPYTESCKST